MKLKNLVLAQRLIFSWFSVTFELKHYFESERSCVITAPLRGTLHNLWVLITKFKLISNHVLNVKQIVNRRVIKNFCNEIPFFAKLAQASKLSP